MVDVYGCYVIEDRGYDSDKHRISLRSSNSTPVIPGRKNRKQPIVYDKSLYKMRGGIEILFGKIKENRRFAMRFDKDYKALLGFIALALIKILIS
jgi:hypothetical protein